MNKRLCLLFSVVFLMVNAGLSASNAVTVHNKSGKTVGMRKESRIDEEVSIPPGGSAVVYVDRRARFWYEDGNGNAISKSYTTINIRWDTHMWVYGGGWYSFPPWPPALGS